MLILAALGATPAAAAPTPPDRPTAQIQRDPSVILREDMGRYGQWLARATEIEFRVQQQLMGLQAAWQQAQTRPIPEGVRMMRAYIQGALAQMDAAEAEIAGLDPVRLELLELPEDLRPPALLAQIRVYNRDIKGVLRGFLPVLDAVVNNPREAGPAALRLLANLRLVFESQLVLIRAQQAATPRDYAEWEILGFEISFTRAAQRIFQTVNPTRARIDPALAADLIAIAGELDLYILRAEQKLTAELTQLEVEVAAAERVADANQAILLRRAHAVIAFSREYLPIARRLSAHLRDSAENVRGRPMTQELIARSFGPMRAIRVSFDELAVRQARLIADAQ